MKIVPLLGSNTLGKSVNITAERRINVYAELYKDPDKTNVAFYGMPGLVRSGRVLMDTPIRGVSEQVTNFGGVVGNDTIFAAFTDLTPGAIGVGLGFFTPGLTSPALNYPASVTGMVTTSGRVAMAFNGFSLLAVDGNRGVNILTGAVGTVTQLPGATSFPVGATSVCFLGGKYFVNDPSFPGRFRASGTYDGTAWAALDFWTAESSADPLTAVAESLGELVALGRDTIEFWGLTGGTDIIRRIGSSGIDWGCTSGASIAKVAGGLCFLGRSRTGGERMVLMLQGHTVTPISDPNVIADINASSSPDSATGIGYTIAGHQFYQVNLPETSWCYDFTSGFWSELQTDGGRAAGNYGISAFGKVVVSDYRDGRIYTLDPNTYTDDGNAKARELWTRHIFHDLDRVSIQQLQLDMEAGVGTVPAVYPTSLVLGTAGGGGSQGFGSALGSIPNTISWCMEAKVKIPGAVYAITTPASIPIMSKRIVGGGIAAPEISISGSPQAATVILDNSIFTATAQTSPGGLAGVVGGGAPGNPSILDTWFMLSVSYENTTGVLAIYANGVLLFTETVVRAWGGSTAGSVFEVGRCAAALSPIANWGTQYSEVRVWSTSRTQAQIQANMNLNLTGMEAGIAAFWGIFSASAQAGLDGTGLGRTMTWGGTNYVTIGSRDDVPLAPQRNAQMMMQMSQDGGHTFGNERWADIGAQGAFTQRVIWNKVGMARDALFRFRMTDPSKFAIANGAMTVV